MEIALGFIDWKSILYPITRFYEIIHYTDLLPQNQSSGNYNTNRANHLIGSLSIAISSLCHTMNKYIGMVINQDCFVVHTNELHEGYRILPFLYCCIKVVFESPANILQHWRETLSYIYGL